MNKLSQNLFWDVNFKNLDYQKDADFIIERVLNFGDEDDYKKIKKIYGLKKIRAIAKKINYINQKNINFWGIIFNISPDLFQCTQKFLTKKQNAFLRR